MAVSRRLRFRNIRFAIDIWRDEEWLALQSGTQWFLFLCWSCADKNDRIPDIDLLETYTGRSRRTIKTWLSEAAAGGFIILHTDGSAQLAPTDAFRPTRATQAGRGWMPVALRAQVYERDGHACLACGSVNDLTLDHIWPVSLGGSTTFENLQTLCRPCNSRKGARV